MRFERRTVLADPTVPNADRRSLDFDCSSHTHDYFELELILEGEIEHTVNGVTSRIGRGDAYLLLPSDIHSLKILKHTELINISFTEQAVSPSLLYEFIASGAPLSCHLSESEFDELEPLFSLAVSRRFGIPELDRKYRKNICECILISMLGKLNVKPGQLRGNSALFRGLLYINRNFEHPISLATLAEAAGLSKNYFSSEFNRTFGMSVSEYISAVRLEYAHSLLISSDLPITRIALESGFSSFSMFSRSFRQKYGETPSECRRQHALADETSKTQKKMSASCPQL